jgi:hypothetical protein
VHGGSATGAIGDSERAFRRLPPGIDLAGLRVRQRAQGQQVAPEGRLTGLLG